MIKMSPPLPVSAPSIDVPKRYPFRDVPTSNSVFFALGLHKRKEASVEGRIDQHAKIVREFNREVSAIAHDDQTFARFMAEDECGPCD